MGSLLSASICHTPGTQAPAQVLKSRSDGIKDLRFGYTIDDEWMDQNPDAFFENHRQSLPPVKGVGYYFVAATITTNPNHPLGILIGDIMVRGAQRFRAYSGSGKKDSFSFRTGFQRH